MTSFTLTKIIQSEQKEDLKTGLISLLYRIKPNQLTVIRVDPHSSFVSLKEDAVLLEYGIQLEIGHEKNINKNGVAEKSIQELEAELVKISPGDQPVTEIELIKATHLLNNRIRHTHRSVKELLVKRNQDIGESLEFNNKEIAQSQEERREKDNALKTEKETKANIVTKYELGDLVFVISDKKKHTERDAYVVTKVGEKEVNVVKAKSGKTAGKTYVVKKDNIYKALPTAKQERKKKLTEEDDEEKESKQEQVERCFYCKRAGYKDCYHGKEECPRYQAVAPRKFVKETKEKEESDSDSEEERQNEVNSEREEEETNTDRSQSDYESIEEEIESENDGEIGGRERDENMEVKVKNTSNRVR